MFTCCSRNNISRSPSEHIYELPQYNKIGSVILSPPVPPPRRTRLLLDDYGCLHPPTNQLNTIKLNTKPSFNSLHTCKLSLKDRSLSSNSMPSCSTFTSIHTEIEPLFTVELKIKNERTGLTINRKMFM